MKRALPVLVILLGILVLTTGCESAGTGGGETGSETTEDAPTEDGTTVPETTDSGSTDDESAGTGGDSDGDGGSGAGTSSVAVTYDAGVVSSGTAPVDSTVYLPGDTVTVLGNTGNLAPSNDDLVFDGWVAQVGTEALTLTAGDTFEIGSEDVTLVPNWTTAEGVDASSYDVEFTFYTEDASDLPMQVAVDETYLGCITETGPENGVTGTFFYYAQLYTERKYGDGRVAAGLTTPSWQEGAPVNTATNLDVDMTDWRKGLVGAGFEPTGGWPDGCGGTGGGPSTNTTPADVPSDSTGAVDGSDYGYSTFEYYGNWGVAGAGYNTDVYLNPTASGFSPELGFWIYDNSDSIAIDPGTYTLNTSGSSPGTLTMFELSGNYDNYGDYSWDYSYGASPLSRADFESDYGPVDVYDELVAGTVEVSISTSDEYTFTWRFDTADGEYIAGSYTGAMDEP